MVTSLTNPVRPQTDEFSPPFMVENRVGVSVITEFRVGVVVVVDVKVDVGTTAAVGVSAASGVWESEATSVFAPEIWVNWAVDWV